MLFSLAAFLPQSVPAQSEDPGAIVVRVTDAGTGAPIDNAQVFLLGGDTPQNSLTNAQGVMIFSGLLPGLYRVRIEAAGYESTPMTDVEVAEGQRLPLDVKLISKLRTIASVKAHSSVRTGEQDLSEESAQRKISPTLSDSLNKLAGVIADDEMYGANSAFNISLRNADVSQTVYSIDGIHIGGNAAQIAGGAQDLFSGASVNFAPAAGGLGGSVNFVTLQPSKTWNYGFTGSIGNYGTTSGSWEVTGGHGKISTAFQHTGAGGDSPLNGMFYADQTGRAYEHLGGWARTADLMKVHIAISPASTLRLDGLAGGSRNSYICNSFTTLLPCGDGPGNAFTFHYSWNTLSFESLAGHFQYTLGATFGNWTSQSSTPNRGLDGSVSPAASNSHAPWYALSANASTTARRHTVSFGGWMDIQNNYATQTYDGVAQPENHVWTRDSGAFVSDKVKSNDKLAFTHTLSQASATGAGSSLEFSENVTWQPAKNDTFSASLGMGSAQPAQTFPFRIGDALSADYDCHNGSVFVQGPGDAAVRQASQSYDAGWRHSLHGGFVNVSLYRTNMIGQSTFAAVPAAAEPDWIFPGGSAAAYLQQLQQVWSSPAVCGSTPFSPQRVYVNQSITGLAQVTQGVTISGQIPVGKHGMLYPRYATASAYFDSLDPRMLAAGSYYAPGSQLPHRPLHTAGLLFDRAVPRAHMEWLLGAQFTSANNGNNLPGYTIFNGGIVMQGRRGSVTFTVSNIFGTHTGLFTTYEGVNPMPVQGGGTFAYATTPLSPRTISLTYRVRWHQPAKKSGKIGKK